MPLSDLIRTLNVPSGSLPGHYARSGLDQPFVAVDGRVFLPYANLRLESHFLPIAETRSGKTHGHAASLQVFGLSNRQPIAPEAVFVLPTDDAEFVYLDRLVRTLHALNYLTRPNRGNLLLQVHARHVMSVPADHGLALEEILRPCGLLPEQITLEIDIAGVEDLAHLIRAVASYRSRGYGIAISHFGRRQIDFGILRELQPDIVKLDSLLVSSTRPLKPVIEALHELPAQVLIEGIDTAAMRKGASARNIDLLQAHAPLRRLLHAVPVAPASNSIRIRSAA
jgi:EAL domain-containing protein (putative c-di-GMP-specific phosphodiesterase class I)